MTARELKLVAKHTANAYNMSTAVVFSDDGFKTFCDQICKEQREICADKVHSDVYSANVINASMPEL